MPSESVESRYAELEPFNEPVSIDSGAGNHLQWLSDWCSIAMCEAVGVILDA